MRKTGVLMAAAAAMFISANTASAMYILDNPYEQKCALGMNKGLAKFTSSKAKCVTKCQQGTRKVPPTNPASDCVAPYGGTTLSCIADPIKGAEAKAIAKIGKGCVIDCPECYPPDCNTFIPNRVFNIESQLDLFVPLIWCDDSGSGDVLTKGEAKCMDTVAKTLAKFVGAKGKCYDKCLDAMFKGKIPVGYSCLPPATEPVTQNCIALAEAKAAASIDKVCSGLAENPECYVPNFDTGNEWVAIAEAAVDGNITQTYCGSPSGAFLD